MTIDAGENFNKSKLLAAAERLPPDDHCIVFAEGRHANTNLKQRLHSELRQWLRPSRDMPRRWWPLAVGIGYVVLIATLGGLMFEHCLVASAALLDYYNERTRRLLWSFLGFISVAVLFDSLRYYYWFLISFRYVHVKEPYELEKTLFGIYADGKRETLNEYFDIHHLPSLDILCGSAYISFVNVSICSFMALLFSGQARLAGLLSWSFFCVNCLGYSTYFLYPVAPPWYVTDYGLGPARMNIRAYAASGLRFDQLVGAPLFEEMYSHEVAVYGSYPSLHVAYPLLIALAVWRLGRFRPLFYLAFSYYALMCFSAIYLQHHYVVDVILGTGYAFAAMWIVEKIDAHFGETRYSLPLVVSHARKLCAG